MEHLGGEEEKIPSRMLWSGQLPLEEADSHPPQKSFSGLTEPDKKEAFPLLRTVMFVLWVEELILLTEDVHETLRVSLTSIEPNLKAEFLKKGMENFMKRSVETEFCFSFI